MQMIKNRGVRSSIIMAIWFCLPTGAIQAAPFAFSGNLLPSLQETKNETPTFDEMTTESIGTHEPKRSLLTDSALEVPEMLELNEIEN